MTDALTRRQLLIGGAVLLVSGCTQNGATSRGESSPHTTFPPYDLGTASTPPPTAAGGAGLVYVVMAGDTLSGISRRSGVDLETIVQSNHLLSAQLERGQRLWLPGASAIGEDPVSHLRSPQEAAPEGEAAVGEQGGYVLVHRDQWAVAPVRGNNLPMNGVSRITLHHTGEHAGLEGVAEVEVLRRIEHYHQFEKHWAAIGYHYLVGKTGRVYEGRPVHYQGAHVLANNEHNLGISVIGDFMNKLPNATQLATVDAFLTDQRLRFHVPRTRIYGHRQLGTSLCPGDALYGWLQHYRA